MISYIECVAVIGTVSFQRGVESARCIGWCNIAVGCTSCRKIDSRRTLLKHLEPCFCNIRLCSGNNIQHGQTTVLAWIFIHIDGDLVAVYADIQPVLDTLNIPFLAVCRHENSLLTTILGDYGGGGGKFYRGKVRIREKDIGRLAAGCQQKAAQYYI